MLLVDDDQTQVANGCEDSRAGADHDVDVAAENLPPLRPTLRRRERAMQHADASWKARVDPIEKLRRQGNLRNQNQAAPAERARMFGGAQINFGLAAAGDTMKQESLKASLFNSPGDRAQCAILFRG